MRYDRNLQGLPQSASYPEEVALIEDAAPVEVSPSWLWVGGTEDSCQRTFQEPTARVLM